MALSQKNVQRGNKKMVTIKEIAKECNVSVATVSNILNHKPGASDETRRIVMAKIKELNYKPNTVARNLKTKNTRTIGVIVEDMTIFSIPDIVDGITEHCEENNYQILLINLRLFKKLTKKNVDDLLEKTAEALKENNMAIDINTGTYYRYPINEISPYEDFMKLVKKYEIPVILSSDAHEPGHAGFMIKEAAEYALSFGIDKFLRFDKKKRISEMICLKNK
mgnify:CR=1 FL=1